MSEGEPIRALHVIIKGEAACPIGGAEVGTLTRGDHFGEDSLVERTKGAERRGPSEISSEEEPTHWTGAGWTRLHVRSMRCSLGTDLQSRGLLTGGALCVAKGGALGL